MSEEKEAQEEYSLLFQLVTAPKYLGEAVLKIISNNDKATHIKMMVGYGIIIALILVFMAIIAPDILKSLFYFVFLQR